MCPTPRPILLPVPSPSSEEHAFTFIGELIFVLLLVQVVIAFRMLKSIWEGGHTEQTLGGMVGSLVQKCKIII